MITAAQTRVAMASDPQWWKIALFDFVDDFRLNRNLAAIKDPFRPGDKKLDAALASTIEFLCDELDLRLPNWVERVPPLRVPFFVSGIESLKATAIVQSPARFRVRNVFVLESLLERV